MSNVVTTEPHTMRRKEGGSKSCYHAPQRTQRMAQYFVQLVRVAQLDRASDYGSEGREFESSRARE